MHGGAHSFPNTAQNAWIRRINCPFIEVRTDRVPLFCPACLSEASGVGRTTVCKLGAPAAEYVSRAQSPSPHCNCGPPTSRMSHGDVLPLFALYYIAITRCKLPTTIVLFILFTYI